ncbi:transposase [Acetomicrobium sp.]|jgi:transposase|uniref:transposase n=1 Tax=Acetomicrobium sp. TaxID=1872099 RepID=UPI002FCC22DC
MLNKALGFLRLQIHKVQKVSNTLKRWREPILNYFDNKTTNASTEGKDVKERLYFGLRNVEAYVRMMIGFLLPEVFHVI